MDKVLQGKLKTELLQRKKELADFPDQIKGLREWATNVQRLYGPDAPRCLDYRSRANRMSKAFEEENALIDEALSELKKGNPQKAQEVLQREMPKRY